ncbi:YkuS family protein [Clostridium sp. YIM B02515]|uniref:YkuS family protein n=1 Tax=Clostridium rhizosphaerae TaxID=2803861 RepID=A0ABS1TGA5_9CLOT|nr:YkuS family protein [Clostridium rhizosphaerae]MBL4938409.1 YkuS family protein [Clostridium rhizosphaerae]
MTICISEELDNIKEELINRGYNVVNDANISCDVIICNLKNGGLVNLNVQGNIKREGTLVIDSGSKNIDEIEYILNNRVYSSLF